MKLMTFALVTIILCSVGCSTTPSSNNYQEARDFLNQCKSKKIAPLLYNIDDSARRHYINLPEIKAFKSQLRKNAKDLNEFLLKDEVFSHVHTETSGGPIWRKAYAEVKAKYKEDPEYVKLYDQWEKSKVEYYIGVFERIIDDYEKQGTPFSLAWIENNGYPPEAGKYPTE